MRAFVAIYPPPEVREDLLRTVREFLSESEFRLATTPNVHLTLKFLGKVEEENIPTLRGVLDAVCGRHTQFEIKPGGIGAFPSPRKARIVWAGVDKGADELLALAEDLEDSLYPAGFGGEEKGFKPHITLGRSRNRPGRLPEAGVLDVPGFLARQIELVRSSPGKGAPTYDTISAHPLRRTPKRLPKRLSDRE